MSTTNPTTPDPDPVGALPGRRPGAHRNPYDEAAPPVEVRRTFWGTVLGVQLIVDGLLLMVLGRLRPAGLTGSR
jgi:hypothetical protein